MIKIEPVQQLDSIKNMYIQKRGVDIYFFKLISLNIGRFNTQPMKSLGGEQSNTAE